MNFLEPPSPTIKKNIDQLFLCDFQFSISKPFLDGDEGQFWALTRYIPPHISLRKWSTCIFSPKSPVITLIMAYETTYHLQLLVLCIDQQTVDKTKVELWFRFLCYSIVSTNQAEMAVLIFISWIMFQMQFSSSIYQTLFMIISINNVCLKWQSLNRPRLIFV